MTSNPLDPQEVQAVAKSWNEFEFGLRNRNRFRPKDRFFIDGLVEACLRCQTDLASETRLYRARTEPLTGSSSPLWLPPEELRAPDPRIATGGRLNPQGIPYLYAAMEFETAVAEVRPWRGAAVTVGTLRTERVLRLVDLRLQRVMGESEFALTWLGLTIGIPVHAHDPLAYVGTQYLAETLKERGAEGVIYGSAMIETGVNVALFDPAAARVTATFPYRVKDVLYTTAPEKRPEHDNDS